MVEVSPASPQPRSRRAVFALAFLAAIGLGAWTAYQLYPEWRVRMPKAPTVAEVHEASSTEPRPLALDRDPEDAGLGTDSSLSEEPLSLVLVDTQPGAGPAEGTAALGVEARNPQIYRIGALLENGARLAEVHADHIVLVRGEERARLYKSGLMQSLRRLVSPFSPDALQVSDAPDTGSAALLRVGGAPAEKPVPPPRESALARTLLAQPHFEAEKLVGFEVHPGARRQAFEQLGLVPGDVVRFVGGEPITGEAQWRAIVEPLGRGERVNVTVSRQGTLVHLALDGAIFSSGSRNANEG